MDHQASTHNLQNHVSVCVWSLFCDDKKMCESSLILFLYLFFHKSFCLFHMFVISCVMLQCFFLLVYQLSIHYRLNIEIINWIPHSFPSSVFLTPNGAHPSNNYSSHIPIFCYLHVLLILFISVLNSLFNVL